MPNDNKLLFFGDLAGAESFLEQGKRRIVSIWSEEEIRLKGEDLEKMRESIGRIKKLTREIEKYNHSKFSQITNEAIEKAETN